MVGAETRDARRASFRVALQRSVLLMVCLLVVGGVAGGVVGWKQSRITTATALILVNPLDGNPFSTTGRGDDIDNLITEAELVQSFDVANLVKEDVGSSEDPAALLDHLDVSVPTNTQLLQISYSAGDPTVATRYAQSFAEQYLAFRESRARSLVQGQLRLISKNVAQLQDERTALAKKVEAAKSAATRAAYQSQVDALTDQINQLRSRSAELQIGPFNPGQVVTPATAQRVGLLHSWGAFAGAGALAGLLLGLVIAFVRSRADTRLRHVDDVALTGRRLAGHIERADVEFVAAVPSIDQSHDVAVPEAFRGLAASLLTAEHRRPATFVLAAGDDDRASVPSSATGLAFALSASQHRTVVFDTVGALCVAQPQPGASLREVLEGKADVSDASVKTGEFLTILGSPPGDRYDDLLMAPAMANLVRQLRMNADIVLIVTRAITGSAPRSLAGGADKVITEAVEGVSHYESLLVDLPVMHGKDLGVVYVGGAPRRSRATRRALQDRVAKTGPSREATSAKPSESSESSGRPGGDVGAEAEHATEHDGAGERESHQVPENRSRHASGEQADEAPPTGSSNLDDTEPAHMGRNG